MRPLRTGLVVAVLAGLTVVVGGMSSTFSERTSGPQPTASERGTAKDAYARLPMSFVPNYGQMPHGIGYGAQGRGYILGLAPAEAIFAFSTPVANAASQRALRDVRGDGRASGPEAGEPALVRMQLLGADPAAHSSVDAPLPGKANFLIGDDPGRWRSGIPPTGGQVPGGLPGRRRQLLRQPRAAGVRLRRCSGH